METSYLEAAKPELEKYDVLTKQIKAAIKTRKELQAEKKATPILNVLKHRELTSRIEDLTEQLEDLRSERAIILMYNKAVIWALNKERLINSGFYDLATAYQSVHVNY